MKNLLFITPQFPYPLDNGGKIGAYNGISVVDENFNTVVLSFTEEPQNSREGIKQLEDKLNNTRFEQPIFHNIHIRKKLNKLIPVMANDFVKAIPYVAEKYYNLEMLKAIDHQFENGMLWDVVFIDYLNMGIYLDYIKLRYHNQFKKLIFKDHNIEYEIVKQEADKSHGIKKRILEREWKITQKYEREHIIKADIVFSVCEDNTNFLRKYNKNAYTMLPTFDIREVDEKKLTKPSILYMGNLSWGANMDGLKWFVQKVLPLIKKEIPDACLTIVGSGPAENPFTNDSQIDYRGYVKDISHIYDDQSVFIVPLFEGSGIRIKILDAFNNETPVVSTTLGCATIGAKKYKEIYIADTAQCFAEATIQLLEDKKLNKMIAKSAKEFLQKNYSLTTRQQEFADILART